MKRKMHTSRLEQSQVYKWTELENKLLMDEAKGELEWDGGCWGLVPLTDQQIPPH